MDRKTSTARPPEKHRSHSVCLIYVFSHLFKPSWWMMSLFILRRNLFDPIAHTFINTIWPYVVYTQHYKEPYLKKTNNEIIRKTYVIFWLVNILLLIVKDGLDGSNLPLVMVEEGARRVGRSLGVQVNDVHQRRNHKSVTQRQRKTVPHRQVIQGQRTIPIRVLVAALGFNWMDESPCDDWYEFYRKT